MINPQVLRWFEKRGINEETVVRTAIYSGLRQADGAVVEHAQGNVIAFPFIDGGQVVAEKYRAAGKKFFQKVGGQRTFWNADILDDPSLQDGHTPLIITEGELDALSVIEAGNPFVVSVPDGAPPARDFSGKLINVPETDADIDPLHDDKFSYVARNWERLKKIKKIIIATDNDEPGRRLAAELVRRLGRVRCYWVEYPEGCKDINDVLMNHGCAEIVKVLANAQPYPVSGLYRLSGFPEEPAFNPVSTGWGRLDEYAKLFYPSFMVITGFAGSGKTTFANQLAAHAAIRHGWSVAIASYEMRIRPFVIDTLRAAYLSKPKHFWTSGDLLSADDWIENQFVFIAPDMEDGSDDNADIDWLLERAAAAVIRHGIRLLVIDPWNEIEHCRRPGENLTEYTGRAIRALKKFGRRFDVAVIVVAHPTKSACDKTPDQVSLYDVSDSAHFANKADIGMVVARHPDSEITSIFVRKVRYQPETGKLGSIEVAFDPNSRLFSQ